MPVIQKDDVYFWNNARFSVEGCLFQVPEQPFIVGSDYFAEKYRLGEDDGSGAEGAVVELEGATAAQFRTFLKLLFPTLTKEEWLTILTLSTLWHFNDFRKLAIEHLEPDLTDPTELVQVGRAAFVTKWVQSGYERLVKRPEPITEEECDVIGDRTGIRLYTIRHANGGKGRKDTVQEDVQAKFSEELSAIEVQERERRTRSEGERTKEKVERQDEEQQWHDGETNKSDEEIRESKASLDKQKKEAKTPDGDKGKEELKEKQEKKEKKDVIETKDKEKKKERKDGAEAKDKEKRERKEKVSPAQN